MTLEPPPITYRPMTDTQTANKTTDVETVRPEAETITRAADLIRRGKIIALPTETVYGLAVDAADEDAVQALYVAKGRPEQKPFVLQFASVQAAKDWAGFDETAARLAEAFWPGPLTLIVRMPANARIASRITAGGDTIGIRIPANDVALGVLREAGRPLAITSANLSGHPGARSVAEIPPELLAHLSLILDGGTSPIGVASTVLDVTGDNFRILRQGTLTADDIEKALTS